VNATAQTRETARELLHILPLVMRTVAAELRSSGELPVPAHFGLLMHLREQPRTLTELATHAGVSLPTMSNSVAILVARGWVRRNAAPADRRTALLEVTPAGRSALERVGRAAESHLAEVLAPLDARSRRRLLDGLAVLRSVFGSPGCGAQRRRRTARARD
jgi:DNA-binding MarR family transcriptional regulator